MKHTSRFILVTGVFLSAFSTAYMDEPVCHRCEEIREYNKTHHQNYEYYEDYLKDQKAGTMCPAPKKAEQNQSTPPKNGTIKSHYHKAPSQRHLPKKATEPAPKELSESTDEEQ